MEISGDTVELLEHKLKSKGLELKWINSEWHIVKGEMSISLQHVFETLILIQQTFDELLSTFVIYHDMISDYMSEIKSIKE